MNYRKIIYYRPDFSKAPEGTTFANVHLLVGYCPQTLEYYSKMLRELRKEFPQATRKNVDCGIVRQSHSVQGFTLLMWSGYIEVKPRPDWHIVENGRCEYHF